MTIHVIHGIRNGPDSPVRGLLPYLVPYQVKWVDYGFEWELETRVVNSFIVGTMLNYVADGDIVIGHSNGCAIAYELVSRGAPVAGLAFINGALETLFTLPPQVKWCDVYYNAGDEVTELAEIGAKIGLTARVWGELGHRGYSGTDPRVTNINCGATQGMPVVSGHSDFFTPGNLAAWAPYLVNRIKAHSAMVTAA